jgi:Zn-dependent M28 family amino/carboxypeptidase
MRVRASTWRRIGLGVAVVGVILALIVSALTIAIMWMPGTSYDGPLPKLTTSQQQLSTHLRTHVTALAGDIGPRYAGRPEGYARAADYLREQLTAMGYEPRVQTYEHRGQTFENIEVELAGHTAPDEIVVVGAHYDTAGRTPGADDNASGVAGVLELARLMADSRPKRTVRFVLFANEEAPYFHTEAMGSWVYARRAREGGEEIVVMLSLEMLGYYSTEPDSQEYPPMLSMFYPDRGDFIAFVSCLPYREAVADSIGAFREHAQFPSEGLAAPAFVPGVSLSDHWAFWQEDYPAVMVTDTAFYRNPHYHMDTDTPDTLDYTRFALVVDGLQAVVARWADE